MGGNRWESKIPFEHRFWLKVWPRGDCWEWKGLRDHYGYGYIAGPHDVPLKAHRIAYEYAKGPIPDGKQIDHLCRHRWCVRPSHLEAVSHRTNQRRGFGPVGINARKVSCKSGHLFTPENTYYDKEGARHCRTCHRQQERARKQRQL